MYNSGKFKANYFADLIILRTVTKSTGYQALLFRITTKLTIYRVKNSQLSALGIHCRMNVSV